MDSINRAFLDNFAVENINYSPESRVRRDRLFRDRDETDTRPGQSLETEMRPRPIFYQIFETETIPRLLKNDFSRPRRDQAEKCYISRFFETETRLF